MLLFTVPPSSFFALADSSAVKLSAIPFMLLGFLLAVLAQMSLLGSNFRDVSELAEFLSDSFVNRVC